MSHTKASPSPHGVPPSPGYHETMPADQGRDAEWLQAVLLGGSYRQREPSAAILAVDWFMRLVEWVGHVWCTCLSMIGAKR